MSLTAQILAQLPGDPLSGLRRADQLWRAYREDQVPSTRVICEDTDSLGRCQWDVVISGGTLGILIGAALAQKGWRVAVLERGVLRGREQEWNVSRRELQVFRELDLLSEAEIEEAIATEYNPARIHFQGGQDIWVRDVLNIGVDPVFLLETLKQRFLAAGGTLLEHTPFTAAAIHPDGVTVAAEQELTTRLLIDAMGHFSPIARQARCNRRPDAVCMVVGTCATGFSDNPTGDLLVSFTPLQNQCQYFWEAFPARDGRTTYLFTYLDAHPDRPSLEQFFEEYWRLLPEYQGVELDQLQWQRVLYGFFPCYRQSPLRSPWSRLLFVGDSSGNQSPLSFGGFGAMLRHLQRLTEGTHQALQGDLLDRRALGLLQPYQPNLSVTWLFQRTMSAGIGQSIPPDQINHLLARVFQQMEQLGDPVLKPFLQDVVQFPALLQTLARTTLSDPGMITKIIPQVGVGTLLEWMGHYSLLGLYSGLNRVQGPLRGWSKTLPDAPQYYIQRWLDAIQYGSGSDYSQTQDF